jgi:hypothetical protein
MSDVTDLVFFTKAKFYKLITGIDEQGRPICISSINGTYRTSDPGEIEALMEVYRAKPYEVWPDPDSGTILCPECYKPFKSEFGLQGHMRTHNKEEVPVDGQSVEDGDE